MFKNIGKKIQLLAVILAILSFVGFLALAVFFLISLLGTEDALMRTAGMQGMLISLALAVITPMLTWILYGFGSMILCNEKRLENEKETKELLRHALAEGGLSDDISRKTAVAIAKVLPTVPVASGRPPQPVARPGAPVARPVTPPAPAPVMEQAAPAPTAEPAKAPAPVMEQPAEKAEPAPITAPTPPAPRAPAAPARPTLAAQPVKPAPLPGDLPGTVSPLQPMNRNEETF